VEKVEELKMKNEKEANEEGTEEEEGNRRGGKDE
jgi:hypothetical protein